MLSRLPAFALLAFIASAPGPVLSQVTAPGTIAVCADLAMEVIITPKGREQATVTLRVRNDGPGDYPGVRGGQWVEHVVTINGQEVERKKNGFTTIAAGGKKEFTFTRNKSDGDFGVWAVVMHAPASGGQKGANQDCNSSNDGAVTPFLF